jgi:hypothetical protein
MPFLAYNAEDLEGEELFSGEAEEGIDELDEAARGPRRMRPPIRTPRPGGNVPPRPSAGFATRAELSATASRLDAKIVQVSTGIKALDGRVRSLDNEHGKLRASLSAEAKKREALVGQVNNLQQMSMLLPLLSTQKTAKTAVVLGPELPAGSNVVTDSGDSLSRILPMLLFSGAGSSSGQSGSGGMFGGDNNTMMMLAMVMAMKP